MRAHSIAIAALLSLSLHDLGAQARQITLPDTLGASFSVADSATAAGSPADFDFLVGMWHFKFQQRRPDGTFNPPFVGHWWGERRRSPNAVVEDRWRSDNSRASMESGTYTYRVFNPARKIWEMQGVDSERGAFAPGLAWSDGSNRYLVQWYGTTLMRIRYFDITETGFFWRADQSVDGGKSWQLDHWIMQATRIGK